MESSPFDIAEIIERLGVLGGAIVAIWAFVTGKIWPQKMVEKMIDAQQEAAEKSAEIISTKITGELSDGIRKAMIEGIAEGYLKINGDR